MEIWEHDIISDIEGAIARTVLYSVYESPVSLGRKKTSDVLRGAVSSTVFSLNLNTLETYGLLGSYKREQIFDILDKMVEFGLLEVTEGPRPVLKATAEGEKYFQGGQVPHFLKEVIGVNGFNPDKEGEKMMERLVKVRARLAETEGVLPYRIFSNKTLIELVRTRPADHDQLASVYGLGDTRIENFGDDILKAIKA